MRLHLRDHPGTGRARNSAGIDAGTCLVPDAGLLTVKLGRLNHVGVATPSIADAIRYWRDTMGATGIGEPFDLPAQGVKVCFVDTSNTQIELIEPYDDKSPINGFLARNPAGGQHHLCYEVDDIHAAKAWFDARRARLLGEPRIGAHGTPIFFVHPRDMGGVLTEIMETPKDEGH